MNKMDASLLLGEFEAEAKAHIEKIETAFLDVDVLSGDSGLINNIFRAAHSLKGTASFFSLSKIVGIAHELESLFSKIKDGKLFISDDISDIVMQSVDCLKDLADNMRDDSRVETESLVRKLKNYSGVENVEKSGENTEDFDLPFDCNDEGIKNALKNAVRHGHKIYYVNIGFNRSLGKYYKHPEEMLDNILSIGSIVAAALNSKDDNPISLISFNGSGAEAAARKITDALAERDTSTLELLVTSVLELDLFSIAVEINANNIRLLAKETVLTGSINERGEKTAQTAKSEQNQKPEGSVNEPRLSKKINEIDEIKEIKEETAKNEQSPLNNSINKQLPVQESSFSIRLDVAAINNLMDLANEMILARNRLLSAMSDYKKSIPGITPILHDMNRLTSEIQEKVMLTRMQPISMVFGKFPRIIRDTAKALGKDIKIEIFGDEVMLDKYLLDALADPVTQLVKNSADHGIESAERRDALGKPPKGKITLNAYMRDGLAFIEVSDDGAGINTDALKRKIIEKGIMTEETVASMKKSEIFALMFEPGISTARQITNFSGRGVGMDIVKTNIEKLGGSIEVDSEIDIGTTVRLKMPLTLSVTRTLIVTVDSVQYAAPEIHVERIVRIWNGAASRRLEKINKSLVLIFDGRIIPVITMRDIDAKAGGREPPSADDLLEQSRLRGVSKFLVLKAEGRTFALMIDDATETEETLVKPLPVYLKKCPCYSNVTVLGNGNAIMILDAAGIVRFMGIGAEDSEMGKYGLTEGLTADEDKDNDIKQIIIFKCSGSEYFALETSEISRIEVVEPRYIQEIGGGRFVNIAGESIRVVRPEYFAPVKKRAYTEKKLYMLTLKKSVSPTGFLVSRVLDKVEGVFKLDGDRLYSDFIYGTSVFDEKILIFLNPKAIAGEVEKEKLNKKKVKSYF